MPQCEKYEAMLAAISDGRTDKTMRAEIQAHLDICSRCRQRTYEQTAIRHQLRLLAQRDAALAPPVPLWERAAAAWDAQDKRWHRTLQMRWALAGSCMLTLLLSVVWARMAVNREFPIDAALRDFRAARAATPTPFFITGDADRAARWLRSRLNADLPPINLSLSRAELLGADVIVYPERRLGRLLYRTPQGLVGVYVVPGSTHFAQTVEQMVEDHDFQVKSTKDAGFYGWEANGVGYGIVLAQPVSAGRAQVINAEHASEQPGVTEQ